MIKTKISLTPGAAARETHSLFPELRQVTGEQGQVYCGGMIKQEFTMMPPMTADMNGCPMEFGRAKDVQNISGVKRGLLHLLVAEGKIKSVLIRRKGNLHGTRYYYIPSVLAYMYALMQEQENNNNLSGPAGSGPDCGENQRDGIKAHRAQQTTNKKEQIEQNKTYG